MIFGMRHRGGGNNFLNGKIHRAQLYDRALGPDEIAASAGVESTFVSEAEFAAAREARIAAEEALRNFRYEVAPAQRALNMARSTVTEAAQASDAQALVDTVRERLNADAG